MNTKLSGAQLVLVPITKVGRNYLPEVQYLNGRMIKYIDFYPANYLPGITTALAVSASTVRNRRRLSLGTSKAA